MKWFSKALFGFLIICAGLMNLEAQRVGVQTFSYGDHERHRLDVVSPSDAKTAPVLVFFHGGGWVHGDKKTYQYLQRRFAREGVVTVSANYRLSPDVQFPAFVNDAAEAVAWTQKNIKNYGGDPKRIFLMGHSAGAHIVALLGLDESYLQSAGVAMSAIQGVIPISAPLLLKASQVPQFSFVFGKATDKEMWPLAFIDGSEPPFLLLQGEQDILVQPFHSRIAEKMIKDKGGDVTAHYYPKHDHMTIIGAFSTRFESKGNVLKPVLQMITGTVQ